MTNAIDGATEFAEWFSLKPGRFNFEINPERDPRDQQFLFGREDWKGNLHQLLETCLLLRQPVRLVLWGQYGIGKTHRIYYLKHHIQEKGLRIQPVYVVCRDINEKSTFGRLHFDLVNNVGREFFTECAEEYWRQVRTGAAGFAPLGELCPNADIVRAVDKLGLPKDSKKPAEVAAAWKFLTGLELDVEEQLRIDVTADQIESSTEYAGVLKLLGHVIFKTRGLHLMYLVDQVEALSRPSNKPAEVVWVETLRAILDLPEVGLVVAIGADHMDQLPRIMTKPEIVRRFRLSNYVQMAAYKRGDTTSFISGLLQEWTDGERRDALAKKHGWDEKVYKPECYPFTFDAFDVFCRHFSDEFDPNHAKPSEIIDRLNRVAVHAFRDKKPLIDKAVLEQNGITV